MTHTLPNMMIQTGNWYELLRMLEIPVSGQVCAQPMIDVITSLMGWAHTLTDPKDCKYIIMIAAAELILSKGMHYWMTSEIFKTWILNMPSFY